MNRHARRKAEKTKRGLRWISNDVANPDQGSIIPREGETQAEAFSHHMRWRSQFIVGPPAPTKELSVNELIDAGIIGLYVADLSKFY